MLRLYVGIRGLSFFSSRKGFVCDNVVNYEVVLASGKVVDSNKRENPNLFKSLRGGGNNFGVVTRFDMRTFKQGPFWGSAVFYFENQFPAQIEALVNEVTKLGASEEIHIIISLFFAEELAVGGTKGGLRPKPSLLHQRGGKVACS